MERNECTLNEIKMEDKQPLLISWYLVSLSKIQNDCLTVLVNTLIPTGPTYIIFSCILFERP